MASRTLPDEDRGPDAAPLGDDPAARLEEVRSRFALAAFLPYRVVALGQSMGHGIARTYSDEFGLTIPEWRVLASIGQHEVVTAARVVQETPMDKATVSRGSAQLAEKGLIERQLNEDDRRSALLRLTPQGASVFVAVAERALDYEARLLSRLTKAERAQLLRLLSKLDDGAAG